MLIMVGFCVMENMVVVVSLFILEFEVYYVISA